MLWQNKKLLYFVTLIVIGVIIFILLISYLKERAHNQQVFIERGKTLIQIVSDSLSLQTRMGCYRAQRVMEIINSVSMSPNILFVGLLNNEGKVIASAGEALEQDVYGLVKTKQIHWDKECVVLSHKISMEDLQRGKQHRYGMAMCPDPLCAHESMIPWNQWGTGPFYLLVCLDTKELQSMNMLTNIRFLIFTLLSVGISVLSFVVLYLYQRKETYAYELNLAQEKAKYNEHLAQIGAGLAHETKNPLSIVRGLAQAIQEEVSPETNEYKYASQIIDETDRSVRQINNFLELTHPHSPKFQSVSLQEAVQRIINLLEIDTRTKGITIKMEGENVLVKADPEYLRRMLVNLFLNAIQACSNGDTITVQTEITGKTATIHIIDTGEGIAEEDLPHILKPYFSRHEGGTGLGLSIVNEIVMLHNWKFSITSQRGKGTKVSISNMEIIHQ